MLEGWHEFYGLLGTAAAALAALLLLVINIRNAWDLMISLARRVNPPPSP